jgi:hypothetical protein
MGDKMPDNDNVLLMDKIIVHGKRLDEVARTVCVVCANRIHNRNFDFADIANQPISKVFDRDDDYGRLQTRIRVVEQRFAENLSRPDRYRKLRYAMNPQKGEVSSKTQLWMFAEIMTKGAS